MSQEHPQNNHALERLTPALVQEKFGWKQQPTDTIRFGGTGDRYTIGPRKNILLETYRLGGLITLQIPEMDDISGFHFDGFIAMHVDQMKIENDELILRRLATNSGAEMAITITKAGEITFIRGQDNDFNDSPVAIQNPPNAFSQAVELITPTEQELKTSA